MLLGGDERVALSLVGVFIRAGHHLVAHANVCEVVVGGRIGLAAVLHGLRHQLLGLLGGRIPLHPAERPGAAAMFPQCSCDADCIVSVPVLISTMSFRRGTAARAPQCRTGILSKRHSDDLRSAVVIMMLALSSADPCPVEQHSRPKLAVRVQTGQVHSSVPLASNVWQLADSTAQVIHVLLTVLF